MRVENPVSPTWGPWRSRSCSVLSSQDPAGESGSPTGLYLKPSLQMFLPGKSFEETRCRRNVKTSVLRSERKGWKAGGQFLCGLSERPPCNFPVLAGKGLLRHVALGHRSLRSLSARVSGDTVEVPSSPWKLYCSSCEGRHRGLQTVPGPGPGSELGEMPFLAVSALL